MQTEFRPSRSIRCRAGLAAAGAAGADPRARTRPAAAPAGVSPGQRPVTEGTRIVDVQLARFKASDEEDRLPRGHEQPRWAVVHAECKLGLKSKSYGRGQP